ncbi:alpha-D-xyloside xylohydrolase [Chitinophaga sp. YR573]|uniref:glycoside hydrolase family 31 protein n=1 Tax=Chitinophaga sp. YR573 TaxID=1881040 RepID=UPI0008CB08ED|nr:TIM-barrel domain-containing protein [Chitinophaga sp. YR573]SEW37787.1 alpha-D-xyloside xylohydrolase [Chitinophaga sp. YR573]
MKKKRLFPLVFFTLCIQFCYADHIERLKDGLLIRLERPTAGGAKQVKLQVISDRIIRVTASANDSISTTPSLISVVSGTPDIKWTSDEKDNKVTLNTKELMATVNLGTGEVVFMDKAGNVILQEKKGGGKTFTTENIDGHPLYRLQQVFESPAGEAFYGLGQHQTGQMNYKDQDVNLTQFNSVAVVPFLVSSHHYGILWDNYSITRFGDDRPYEQLGKLLLYNKEGKPDGLTATYALRQKPDSIFLQRNENKIDYAFIPSLSEIPVGYPMAKGVITWEGSISPLADGLQKFYITASGYIKIWVDGELMLDKWREGWNPGPSVFQHQLYKGHKHAVKVEWIPESDQAFISIKQLSPTPETLHNKIAFTSEAGEKIDYYFIYGNNTDEVIAGYREVTGAATIVPKWALGYWQSRERYKSQREVISTVQEFRKKNIPIDNIVMDWSYWKQDAWGSQEFDPARFPDAKGMIDSLHRIYHTHFMISAWPKFYKGIDNYKLLDNKGWLYKQNIKDEQRDWIGQGYVSTFYDAFNPDARKMFWSMLSKSLYSKGVDAWWLDATEPDIYSNSTIEHRKELMNPTALGSSTQYFNPYSLENAKGIYEGQRAENPDQRVFILTRSAFAGIQHYGAATWSGDIASRFDELARQIPAGLNFSLSGLPYWTTDIGGFYVEDKYDQPNPKGADLQEWRELNTRWFQYGAFCPLFRSHGQYPYREPFNIAPENSPEFKSMLYYDQLRYRLMPYIYSLAGQTYHNGYTLMRGLIMDFDKDTTVQRIGDQFMFGPALLVNPVYAYKARTRKLYLPANTGWYNLYSGEYQEGGKYITADAPLDRMPLYVKAGSIIPFGPALQYTSQLPADTITLYVYTGSNGAFNLYEDEGVNYNYEKGQFSNISFTYNEKSKTLTIGKREGSFPGMLQQRSFRVVKAGKESPVALSFNNKNGQIIKYSGNEQTLVIK